MNTFWQIFLQRCIAFMGSLRIENFRKLGMAIALMVSLSFATACSTTQSQVPALKTPNPIVRRDTSQSSQPSQYSQLANGNTVAGQNFGAWVIQASKGLIKDSYLRDGNKLGVVISSQVLPTDVKTLTQSLAQGFRRNFPNQDLTVLIYAPDKKLILTARYDYQSKQIDYQQPT
jgi:hypothetical protein